MRQKHFFIDKYFSRYLNFSVWKSAENSTIFPVHKLRNWFFWKSSFVGFGCDVGVPSPFFEKFEKIRILWHLYCIHTRITRQGIWPWILSILSQISENRLMIRCSSPFGEVWGYFTTNMTMKCQNLVPEAICDKIKLQISWWVILVWIQHRCQKYSKCFKLFKIFQKKLVFFLLPDTVQFTR